MRRALVSLGCVLAGCASDPGPGASGGTADTGIVTTADGAGDGDGDADATEGDDDPSTGDGDGDGDGDDDPSDDGGGVKFDLAPIGDNSNNGCNVPWHNPCDDNDDDPWHALGINCPGELEFDVTFDG